MPGGGVSGMPDCSVTGGALPECSFGQRALLEEGGFVFSEAPEPFRIERSELLGPVDPARVRSTSRRKSSSPRLKPSAIGS